jgi:lipid-binding SYLF domain-containing protein
MNRHERTNRGMAAMVLIAAAALFSLAGVRPAHADQAQDTRELVDSAHITFDHFQSAPEMSAFRELVRSAKGIFIAPQVIKGAFIFGASGGSGILLVHDQAKAEWHGPAFYTIGELSWGLQIGGEASEIVLLAMTDRGVSAFLSNNLKLGADVGVAAGPVGIGASANTANLSADIISFSRSMGLFGGISLNGAIVAVRPNLNQSYYGSLVDPTDILIRHAVTNEQADTLISTVAKAADK